MKYLIVIEKTKTGYGAYLPDVDGCIAVGKTRREVVKSLREALASHFELMGDDGEHAPKATSSSAYIEVTRPRVNPNPTRRGFAVPPSVRAARTAARYSHRRTAEAGVARSRP